MLATKILKELKKALEEEKGRLQKELSRFARPDTKLAGDFDTQAPDLGGTSRDRDIDADTSESEEYGKLIAVEQTLELRLKEVSEALERIDKPEYGICSNCKRPISIERLRANPAAATCLKC